MPAPNARQEIQEVPLAIVGGNKFGRYPKISNEATWNFIVSDGWLVPYAGYKNILTLNQKKAGRGIYTSFVNQAIYAVIGSAVYRIIISSIIINGRHQLELDPAYPNGIFNLTTDEDDVYISENNGNEICITDGVNVYVYNYVTKAVSSSTTVGVNFSFPFTNPGYISFQNQRLIIACTNSTNWVLSASNDATSWSNTAPFVGSLQSKPDFCQAAVPMPGGANNILIFGRNVIEMWQDYGLAKFPYQRNSSFDIDYGCLNPATIAHLKNYVVWLGVNENSGPVLMAFKGNDFESITTDGIDYQLSNLEFPEDCTGFLYQQDGHVIYQFTFPKDNISYAYDFETKLFFSVSDEDLNFHIAREVVYFNNTYYFVSLSHGNLFQFDTTFTYAQYNNDDLQPIPRIRITAPLRLPSQRYYVCKSLGFTVENGQPNRITTTSVYTPNGTTIDTENSFIICCENGNGLIIEAVNPTPVSVYQTASERIGLAISRDGGVTYGSFWEQDMNPTGHYMSRFIFQALGHANDSSYQIRFNGYSRFVVTDGIVEIYQ